MLFGGACHVRSGPGTVPYGGSVAMEQNPTVLLLTCGNSLRNTITGRRVQLPSTQVRPISVGFSAIATGTPSPTEVADLVDRALDY